MKTNTIPLFRVGILAATLATVLVCQHARANVFGIDLGSGDAVTNWTDVKTNGVDFAFVQATEGNYYEDPVLKSDMVNGKAAGVLMGAYHFARPDIDCVSTEANYFWNYAGGYIIADNKSLDPMVDFEVFNGSDCQPDYTAWFNTWAKDVEAKNSGIKHVVIYCAVCSGACDLIEYDLSGGIELEGWLACYNGENLYTGNPWNQCDCCNAWATGCSAANWTYWQVGNGTITGVSGEVGFDAYNGTLADLKADQLVQ
jgi:GH25 family lysozyme M1 (1,4-beta-N-acetylmuramidase)